MFPIAPVYVGRGRVFPIASRVEAECFPCVHVGRGRVFPIAPVSCRGRVCVSMCVGQSVSHCSRVNVRRGRVFPIAPVSMCVEAECFPLLPCTCGYRVFPIASVSMCVEAECFPLLPCQCV